MRKLLSFLLILFLSCSPAWAGVDFDGTDDFLQSTTTPITTFPLTLCCWFNADNVTANMTLIDVVDKDNAGNWFRLVASGAGAGDPVSGDVNNNAGGFQSVVSTSGYTAGTWNHACVIFNSTTDRRAFINGGGKGTSTAASGTPSALDSYNVGRLGRASPTEFTDGKITEVAIWNAALSDSEVSFLASSKVKRLPLQVQPSSLKIYLPMDDQPDGTSADGDIFNDMSQNLNKATGNDGANNTGLTAKAEEVLSYA